MPNIWVLCETSKKSNQHSMFQMQILHFFSFFLLNISHHNVKNEGIACNGPIILWWNLNENGPKFCNTLIIKLGPH
jgi:hypothetical protein